MLGLSRRILSLSILVLDLDYQYNEKAYDSKKYFVFVKTILEVNPIVPNSELF